MSSRAWESRARVGRYLIAANLVVSSLALGALHTPILALSAVLAAISLGLVWFGSRPFEARPAATMIVSAGALLVLWTAFQALPLPMGFVKAIAPENADVWMRSLAPLHEPSPSWITISLDPSATRVQVLRGVTYLMIFVAALRVAHRPEGVAFLERAIAFAGVSMAAAALLHPVFGAQKVWGAYQPGSAYAYAPHHIAPLLNSNHLAAYVNIAALCTLPSVLRRRDAIPRPLALAIVLVLAATTVWTASRGGIGTLVLGVVIAIGAGIGVRRAEAARPVALAAAILVALGSVGMMALSLLDEVRDKLASTDLMKLGLFANAMRLVPRFALVGTGRGSFQSVFPSVRTGSEYYVFTHPENLIAQWTTEWGVPFALLGFGAIAWALRPQTMLARSRPPVGPWTALVAVGLHNLVDFNSEVPGVVVSLAVCAAIVTGGTGGGSKREASRVERWSKSPRQVVIAAASATTFAIAVTLPFVSTELYNEQRRFKELAMDRALAKESFHGYLRDAMTRHPAEPYFPFIGAVRATLARDESILPWAGRALERSPVLGRAHLLLARSLFAKNPSQARLEYRIACEQDSQLCSLSVDEGGRLVADYDDARELVPAVDKAAPAVLQRLAEQLGPRLPSTVVRLDRDLATLDPQNAEPIRRAAEAWLADLRNGESWCAEGACLREGLAVAARAQQAMPRKCDGYVIVAELRIASGEVNRGLDELDNATARVADRSACARQALRLAATYAGPARVDASIDRLTRTGAETTAEGVENLLFAATYEMGRGNRRRALGLYKKAADRAPERDDLLVSIADLAQSQGLHGEALEAYSKLVSRHPGDATYTAALARERDAMTRGRLDLRTPLPSSSAE